MWQNACKHLYQVGFIGVFSSWNDYRSLQTHRWMNLQRRQIFHAQRCGVLYILHSDFRVKLLFTLFCSSSLVFTFWILTTVIRKLAVKSGSWYCSSSSGETTDESVKAPLSTGSPLLTEYLIYSGSPLMTKLWSSTQQGNNIRIEPRFYFIVWLQLIKVCLGTEGIILLSLWIVITVCSCEFSNYYLQFAPDASELRLRSGPAAELICCNSVCLHWMHLCSITARTIRRKYAGLLFFPDVRGTTQQFSTEQFAAQKQNKVSS